MIFKRLIEKIHPSPIGGSHGDRSRAAQNKDHNAERSSRLNLITKRNSHIDLNSYNSARPLLNIRSASSGNALYTSGNVQYGRSKSYYGSTTSTDFENTTCTDSTSSTENVKVEFNDFDDLHLHHDHNTKHHFRNMNHFSKLFQQLNDMRK